MKIKMIFSLGFFCLIGSIHAKTTSYQVTCETLLEEMIDRHSLARFPDPAYVCAQSSSYDRVSIGKDQPGWFGNEDRSMFLRAEEVDGHRELVMMDVEGPGSIVRFWMTFAGPDCGRGTLRIYIDNNTQPAVEGSAFDVLSGGLIALPPLSSSVSERSKYEQRGHNLYFPIPYAKRCKITYESPNVYYGDDRLLRRNSERVYYNINYRSYPKTVSVEPFSLPLLTKYARTIDRVQQELSLNVPAVDTRKMKHTDLNTTLRPGESLCVNLSGQQAIRQLTMQLTSDDMGDALRRTVLEIAFDGDRTVWVPVGDFYGIGYKPMQTRTWYTHVDADHVMSAYWVMPFLQECILTLHNLGTRDVTVDRVHISTEKWCWDDRSMYFGAGWHQYTNIITGYNNEICPQDINFNRLMGKGVYVGDAITLFNTVDRWWGEGDEKIYVDGETFPSHFGTGTEDYYGYAWCRPENFTGHPFISQPDGSGNLTPGYTVNTRTRVLDAIPFLRSITVDMELYHAQQANLNYAPTTMWYMQPGGKSLVEPDIEGLKARLAYQRSDVVPPKVEFSIEGENMYIRSVGSGKCYYQNNRGGTLWSNCLQVFWHDAIAGSRLELGFESDFEEDVEVDAVLTQGNHYAKITMYLNGEKIAHELDLNWPEQKTVRKQLGAALLKRGENILVIEFVSPAPGISLGAMGIDKLYFSVAK